MPTPVKPIRPESKPLTQMWLDFLATEMCRPTTALSPGAVEMLRYTFFTGAWALWALQVSALKVDEPGEIDTQFMLDLEDELMSFLEEIKERAKHGNRRTPA